MHSLECLENGACSEYYLDPKIVISLTTNVAVLNFSVPAAHVVFSITVPSGLVIDPAIVTPPE